jgi:signal transduction histidine kinase
LPTSSTIRWSAWSIWRSWPSAKPEESAANRELLGEIRGAGEDCGAFVRRMLEFSKVSCFDSKPTPMRPLIEDTVLMFRQTEDRHLPVDVRLPEEPVVLTIDPILIRHALFNLVAERRPGHRR